ncbi:uncharacterized protein UTRI_01834 [Ustilago trichophora]|uniref:Uncharacterized protein n=1 Tax=Ustilago trichophora TaxID=86804 RepID=A0A5C3E0Z8_9BASI|nr:uncharacterized protein UTRI_01834 [Ustilago trichophora]
MHVEIGCIEAELGHARDTKYPSGRWEWAGAVIEVGRWVAVHCSGLSAGERYRDSHVGGRCEWWVQVIGCAETDRLCSALEIQQAALNESTDVVTDRVDELGAAALSMCVDVLLICCGDAMQTSVDENDAAARVF